jgi:hypothetical protein
MNVPRYQKFLSIGGLAAALVLLAIGTQRAYTVYPDPNLKVPLPPVSEPNFAVPNFGEPNFAPPKPFLLPPLPPSEYRFTDLGLVENTTFTGVVRKEDKLFLTYDASQKRGKRGCPT